MTIPNITNITKLFKQEDGEPFILTPGQEQIYKTIVTKKYRRMQIIAYTQYGKSDIASMALITRAVIFPEKWCIIGATEKKARIIMNYVIKHLFDNKLFQSQLDLEGSAEYERLRRERTKHRLTFRRDGEIMILSAQATNHQAVIDALTGFGAGNLIIDDSSLIPDDLYAMIKRMLGGYKENYLIEFGNPFYRNHFLKSFNNPSYKKIVVDWRQGVTEGRVTQEFIDEMQKEAFFDVLYNCKFPAEDIVDEEGWAHLITGEILDSRMTDGIEMVGTKRLGVDIGEGTAFNSYVIRGDNFAFLKDKDKCKDTMRTVGRIQEIMHEEGIVDVNVYIDDIAIGHGVSDRLKELGKKINAIKVGESARDKEKFENIRAEINWNAVMWLKNGGFLKRQEEFEQVLNMKYKVRSDRRIVIISKEKLRREAIPSPDHWDAFCLTFAGKQQGQQEKFYAEDRDRREVFSESSMNINKMERDLTELFNADYL